MTANDHQILASIETLEAIYFLFKIFETHSGRLNMFRALLSKLTENEKSELLRELDLEVEDVRRQAGALAENKEYRRLLSDARRQLGRAYLSKLFIDSNLFSQYEKVFPRWLDIKPHALVVFDGQTMKDLPYILEVESLLFSDLRLLLDKSREFHKHIEDFRMRTIEDQEHLQCYLRTSATTVFHFLEAYLNGLAYDCFQVRHDKLSIDDHDLLSEWDSNKKRVRYVTFNKKLFRYPVIVANVEGLHMDLSHYQPAHYLAKDGKTLRDALTHPSYYINPKTGFQDKLLLASGINLSLIEQTFEAALQYVTFVEESLGHDPRRTVPWIFL